MSLDPSKHGFKIEEVGSEAELANKSIDVRVPEFQDDFDLDKYKKNPHDMKEAHNNRAVFLALDYRCGTIYIYSRSHGQPETDSVTTWGVE